MNIEIANHLVQLRKKNGLSQEALADQLGLSRQAVSKWERAEASPDTDNLIALAKLYNVTLNQLLLIEQESENLSEFNQSGERANTNQANAGQGQANSGAANAGQANAGQANAGQTNSGAASTNPADGYNASLGIDGTQNESAKKEWSKTIHIDGSEIEVIEFPNGKHIHIHDKASASSTNSSNTSSKTLGGSQKEQESRGWSKTIEVDGGDIHVFDGSDGKNVHVHGKRRKTWMREFPYTMVMIIAYFLLGLLGGWWHPAWLLFLTIPLFSSLVKCYEKGSFYYFAYPVLATAIFLTLGILGEFWAWCWIVFLTIPVFYSFRTMFRRKKKVLINIDDEDDHEDDHHDED